MGNDPHADRRDKKLARRKYGMRVSGRSTKSVLLPLLARQRDVKRLRRRKVKR